MTDTAMYPHEWLRNSPALLILLIAIGSVVIIQYFGMITFIVVFLVLATPKVIRDELKRQKEVVKQ